MDRKRPYLGSGPEIAESNNEESEKVVESGIADSKIIQYPLSFTPPPTKLTKYNFYWMEGFIMHFQFQAATSLSR